MNETNLIVEESLDFLSRSLHKSFHPISSLPYKKDVIRDAIKQYVKKCTQGEYETLQTKYGLLSNFLEDEKARFMTNLDEVLQDVDIEDTSACAKWTSDKKNDEDFKKYTLILTEMNKERDDLNKELQGWFENKTLQ